MVTYVNDLRLSELATGEGSGTWGTTTNTNLELIGEALGYSTEGITTNADTHTTTVADGSTDPGRAMYIKYTGTLDSACTITIGPNTMSRVHLIENATSGSQNIIISQGSGANVTIPAGDVKMVYLDGAGSGAAVVDAFASLSVVDLKVQDDLTVTDDLTVNGDIDLEGSIDVNGTTNLDVVDIDGALTQDGGAVFNEDSADVDFRVESDGNANMLFVNGGNNQVGIGADPSALFHVTHGGGGFDEVARLTSVADSSGDGAFLGFHGNSTSKFYGFIGGYDIGTNEGGVKIGVGNGETAIADSMTKMTIDSSGNVGIKTTTPGSFNAAGNDLVVGAGTSGDNNGITIYTNSNSTGHLLFADGTSGTAGYTGYIGYTHSSDYMTFNTNAGVERMRIRSDGNVGIGSVGMPAYSSYTQLSIGAMGHLMATTASTTTGSFFMSQNAHFDTDGSWETMETDKATQYYQFAGQHIFKRAASTSAGTDITWLDSMMVNASGQFLVGRTTDDVDTIGGMIDSNGIVYSSINETTFNTFLYRAAQSANAYRFYVSGSGQVNAVFTSIAQISDGRLKENVRDYTVGLNDILKLKPRVFDWKEHQGKDKKDDVGFIAQEFEEVFPDWIGNFLHDDLEDAKSVAASELIFPMVNAFKEISAEIESLKAEVAALKGA